MTQENKLNPMQGYAPLQEKPELLQAKDGRWHSCLPYAVQVRGGMAAIYLNSEGIEIKREALARYQARVNRETENKNKEDRLTESLQGSVDAIVQDVKQRDKLKEAWNGLSSEQQTEIKDTWLTILKEAVHK